MDSLNSQVTKALIKQKSKEGTDDPVAISELLVLQLKDIVSSLTAKVNTYESQYSTVAKVKLEKRLKEGVDGKRAEAYQKQVDDSTSKKETMEITWDVKIDALENDKLAIISSYEKKIEDYQEKIKAANILYNSKLSIAKAKKIEALTTVQRTIDTFSGYVNKYYEDVQSEPTVQYPPAYYKHSKDLEDAHRQLKIAEHQLLIVKASSYTSAKSASDIARDKERARIIAEEKAEAIETAARQREEEGRINLEKKAAFAAEEERIKERNKQRKTIIVTPKEDPKKMAIRLAEMKASEEFRAMNGAVEVKEESDKEESGKEEEEKDEDLLEDYRYAIERNLPVPQSTLQKLRERKLM
jgi:hypothetical protein